MELHNYLALCLFLIVTRSLSIIGEGWTGTKLCIKRNCLQPAVNVYIRKPSEATGISSYRRGAKENE